MKGQGQKVSISYSLHAKCIITGNHTNCSTGFRRQAVKRQ